MGHFYVVSLLLIPAAVICCEARGIMSTMKKQTEPAREKSKQGQPDKGKPQHKLRDLATRKDAKGGTGRATPNVKDSHDRYG